MSMNISNVSYYLVYAICYSKEYVHYYSGTGREHRIYWKKQKSYLEPMPTEDIAGYVSQLRSLYPKVDIEVIPV